MWKRRAAKRKAQHTTAQAAQPSLTSAVLPASTKAHQTSQTLRRGQTHHYSDPFTYIHKGTLIVGNLTVPGRARIHGAVHGNLEVAGLLEIAESATVEGSYIHAEAVKIIGTVRADVWAHGKVEIWRTGELLGDIYAASLDIEEGATFLGSSDMRPAGYLNMPAAFKKYVGNVDTWGDTIAATQGNIPHPPTAHNTTPEYIDLIENDLLESGAAASDTETSETSPPTDVD
ncbi:MAG: polymer-forming cytoskeletal protein [Deinococcota bacterium]